MDVTEQVIASHCNLDLQEEMGYTPLHIVTVSGLDSVEKQFLVAHCNMELRTVEMEDDRTVLQLAKQH
jgi:hypothetical protein